MRIEKRDGKLVEFKRRKIYEAISKAFNETYPNESYAEEVSILTNKVIKEIVDRGNDYIVSVEYVQDIVVDVLIESEFKQVAINYITFRTTKAIERIDGLDIEKQLNRLVERDRTLINENANKDSNVFNTQRDLTAGIVSRSRGVRMLPKRVAEAHSDGQIHYHDLDYSPFTTMTNCCLIDFEYMFKNGFGIGNAEVEEPKSIQTAAAQMAQIIANVASSQYGGCSVDRLDELLAPFAEKNFVKHIEVAGQFVDKGKIVEYATTRTKKDIYDAMQSLEYEVNTLYTSNGQTPFVTFGFGLGTSWIEREIQKSLLEVRIEGIGKEKRTAIFPKLVFGIKEGVNKNKDDVNYDIKQLAIQCSAKRMYPDILNYDKLVEITGSYKVPMGCRSFLPQWFDKDGNEVTNGRMNLGVVTLNLPRIALESNGDIELFWEILRERIAIIKEALLYRVERVKEAKPYNAPILYKNGAWGHKLKDNDDVDILFSNKRATISFGYIGLYEVASLFFGNDWEDNDEAKRLTVSILSTLKGVCDKWTRKYGYQFSVYGTPAESLTDRFCVLDREKFGLIENVTDKDYYTNSFHYDTRKNPTPFEKLDFESVYPKYSTGGFIHYCEYPNIQHNLKAIEAVWDYSYDKVAYLGTNIPIDKCFVCGYEGEFEPMEDGFTCPVCNNNDPEQCDVVKRTCGYLGNPNKRPMAKGRHKEIASRVKHM